MIAIHCLCLGANICRLFLNLCIFFAAGAKSVESKGNRCNTPDLEIKSDIDSSGGHDLSIHNHSIAQHSNGINDKVCASDSISLTPVVPLTDPSITSGASDAFHEPEIQGSGEETRCSNSQSRNKLAEATEAKCPSPSDENCNVLEIEKHVVDSPGEGNLHSPSEDKVGNAHDSNVQVPNGKAMMNSPVEGHGKPSDECEVDNGLEASAQDPGEETNCSHSQPSHELAASTSDMDCLPASDVSHGILEVEKLVSDSLVEGNVLSSAEGEAGDAHEVNTQISGDRIIGSKSCFKADSLVEGNVLFRAEGEAGDAHEVNTQISGDRIVGSNSCFKDKDILAEPPSDVKPLSPTDASYNVEFKKPILASPVEVNIQSSTKGDLDDALIVDDLASSVEPVSSEISAQNITEEVDENLKPNLFSNFDGTGESAIQSNFNDQSTFMMEGKSQVALEICSNANDCEENQLSASAENSGTDECEGKVGSMCLK